MNILQEIQSAQPGSDIYGLVEKIAYFSSIKYIFKGDFSDWRNAQKKLERFVKGRISGEESLNLYLKKYLETSAFLESQKHKERTPFDNWISSLDNLGKFISKNI